MDENGKRNALKKSTVLHNGKRNYTIVEVLGAGGFGITYRAEGLVDNIPMTFAVKEFFMSDSCERVGNDMCYSNPVKAQVEAGKKSFFSEARRLNDQKVYHSNLVRINEVFEENNTAYYVMEYIPGLNLRQHFTKPCGEAEALEIMKHVLSALATLHAHNITHLDIKPDNILLKVEKDGTIRPVVIDFGLSKHYSGNGRVTSDFHLIAGSAGYTPLEQLDGAGLTEFTPQADVYAAAATLFFLLTGKDPKKASEISKEWIEQTLPEGVSANVRSTIADAMKVTKSERTQTIAEFAKALGIDIGSSADTIVLKPVPGVVDAIKKHLPMASAIAGAILLIVLVIWSFKSCGKATQQAEDAVVVEDSIIPDSTLVTVVDSLEYVSAMKMDSLLRKAEECCAQAERLSGKKSAIQLLLDAKFYYYDNVKKLHREVYGEAKAFERSERIDSLVDREYNYWLEKGDSEKARKEQLACYENAYKLKETTQLKNKIASMKKRIK